MVFFMRISFVYFGNNKGIVQQRAVFVILILITNRKKALILAKIYNILKNLCCRWTLNDVEWSEGLLNIVKIIGINIHKH